MQCARADKLEETVIAKLNSKREIEEPIKDLSAEMGWEYMLSDAGWQNMGKHGRR